MHWTLAYTTACTTVQAVFTACIVVQAVLTVISSVQTTVLFTVIPKYRRYQYIVDISFTEALFHACAVYISPVSYVDVIP